MVTVHKVAAGAAAPYAAYLAARTQGDEGRGDYYLNDQGRQEAEGRWLVGDRARELLCIDTDQPVSEQQLRNLLAVRFPDDPDRALRRIGGNGRATAAIDLTFSAPKWVSVVWALGSDETRQALEAAHERAVDRALAHAQRHVPMMRRRIDRDTVVREQAGELIASVYRHTTARAVAGRRPDPQLHSHVLLHGALRVDGDEVVAIESRALMVHQREVGACYRAELADRLRELGYAIERNTGRNGRFFEIAGIPPKLLERFSSRHRQVRERIEWRTAERLHGLRQLVELETDQGEEARRRLRRLERDHVAAGSPTGDWEYLQRRDGLHRLAWRGDDIGDRARAALGRIERWGNSLSPAEERVIAKQSRAAKGLDAHGDLDRAWHADAIADGFDSIDAERLRRTEPARELDRRALLERVAAALTAHEATFVDREARAIAFEVAGSLRDANGLLDELLEHGELVPLEDGRFTTSAQRDLEREALGHADKLAAGRVAATSDAVVDGEVDRLRRQFDSGGGLAPEQEAAVRVACSDRQLVVIEGQAGTGKSTALIAAARAEQLAGREVIVTSTGGQAAARLAGELRAAGVTTDGYSTRALQAGIERGRLRLDEATTVIHDEAALAATDEQRFLFAACVEAGARLVEVGDSDQNNPVGAGGLTCHVELLAAEHQAHVVLDRIVRARDESDREMQRALRAGETERVVANLDGRDRLVFGATRAEAAQLAAELWDRLRHEPGGALVVCESSNDHVDELNAQLQAMRAEAGELGREQVAVAGRPYVLHAGDEVVVRSQFRRVDVGTVRNGERATVMAVERGRARIVLDEGRSVVLDEAAVRGADLRLAYAQHSNPSQGATTGHAIDLVTRLSTRRGQYVALTRGRDSHHVVTSYDDLGVDFDAGRDAALQAVADRLARDEPEVASIDIAALPTTIDALRRVADVIGPERAEQVADRIASVEGLPTPLLAVHANELQELLVDFPRLDPLARIAVERVEGLRQRIADQLARVEARRVELEQTSRLRRRERREREARIALARRPIEGMREQLAEQERRATEAPDPEGWVERHAQDLAKGVASVAELARRQRDEHDRALARVRLAPEVDLTDRLGERPTEPSLRELWEHDAAALELRRTETGRLPDREPDPRAIERHRGRHATERPVNEPEDSLDIEL